ncbi:MAG: DNA alkylation repair protein [Planctomycetota bacterium]
MTANDARRKLKSPASPDVAKSSVRFFRTGPGQYGEGDTFIGIKVPTLRTVSREFRSLPLEEIESLLNSPIHEERHLALMVLVLQVAKCDAAYRRAAFDFCLENTKFINNWDLVDCSAPQVVGGYLLDKSRRPLVELTKSQSLWERRIAIVSTQHFIRHDDLADTLAISQRLLKDEEDLIYKAAGWMLREVGKKAKGVLEAFLDQHGTVMPRTMLRYAIEHFSPDQRRACLRRKQTSREGAADGVR